MTEGSDAAKAKEENEFSAERSKEICNHMNEDHGVSVYAMAKHSVADPPYGAKMTDAILKNVTTKCCLITAVYCKGDLCEQRKATFPFKPPLKNPSEIRARLIQVHQQVCRPEYKPGLALFTIIYSCLGWGTLYMGKIGMARRVEMDSTLRPWIHKVFSSSWNFAEMIHYIFYMTLVGHTVMALYVTYHSVKTLKLSMSTTMMWFVAVSVSGLPSVLDFQELLAANAKCKAAKEAKKAA